MRVVSWNCCKALIGEKLERLLKLAPDLAIIQECEQGLVVPVGYDYKWRGDDPRKGLGVLYKGDAVSLDPVAPDDWTYFLPVTIPTRNIRVVATWAYNHRAANRFGSGRTGNAREVFSRLSGWLSAGRSIVAGDFNNSVVWDKTRNPFNFSEVAAELQSSGLTSAYHVHSAEAYGSETRKTYFHTKNAVKSFHIDYCFVHESLRVERVFVADFADWRSMSDHVPVTVDLNDA